MDKIVKKTSDIEVKVGLNEANLPVKIEWRAADNPDLKDFQECKAMMLGFFAKESLETMKMDLWTTEMQINEMDRLCFNHCELWRIRTLEQPRIVNWPVICKNLCSTLESRRRFW